MQIPLLCAILLIVISIPLYFGKCSNIIAGYNDLRQDDKKKINKMRLCRVLAMTLDITAIILMLVAYSIIGVNDTMILGVITLIVGTILRNVFSKIDKFNSML